MKSFISTNMKFLPALIAVSARKVIVFVLSTMVCSRFTQKWMGQI